MWASGPQASPAAAGPAFSSTGRRVLLHVPQAHVSPQGVCCSRDSGVSVVADRPLVGLEAFLGELARVMGSTQSLLWLLPACTPLPSPMQTRAGRAWPGPVAARPKMSLGLDLPLTVAGAAPAPGDPDIAAHPVPGHVPS